MLFYSLLFFIGILLLLPRFLLDAARHGKYAAGWRERLGDLSPLAVSEEEKRPVIWLHCVSVGETQAARPLVKTLREKYPQSRIVVSTVTLTGQTLAREIFKADAEKIFCFPFDFAFSVRRALDAIKPSIVLIMETEIWFRFLHECRQRSIPVALVNGRLSEKSFRGYRKLGFIMRRILNNFSLAVMQSEADAARIAALGLDESRIKISGNIKFDMSDATVENVTLTDELRARFQLDGARPVILAASTHAPEEKILLSVFLSLYAELFCAKENIKNIKEEMALGAKAFLVGSTSGSKSIPHLHKVSLTVLPRLIVAPRHPERFDEVAKLIAEVSYRYARRSSMPSEDDKQADIILLDSIGELRAVYPLAEIVFVGGSIAPTGGHNILEPASAAKPIIVGAHTFNFAAITKEFLRRRALIQLPALNEDELVRALEETVLDLLTDEARRKELGARARAALDENRGATARTVEMLAPLLCGNEISGDLKNTQRTV
jgi:3-deoxy-D-manno-octulosonic-acid transferase